MIDNADELRTLAQVARNRGRHTGTCAAGWNVKRPEMPNDWLAPIEETIIRLRHTLSEVHDMRDQLAGKVCDDLPF